MAYVAALTHVMTRRVRATAHLLAMVLVGSAVLAVAHARAECAAVNTATAELATPTAMGANKDMVMAAGH